MGALACPSTFKVMNFALFIIPQKIIFHVVVCTFQTVLAETITRDNFPQSISFANKYETVNTSSDRSSVIAGLAGK
jgi:hypothetical protein